MCLWARHTQELLKANFQNQVSLCSSARQLLISSVWQSQSGAFQAGRWLHLGQVNACLPGLPHPLQSSGWWMMDGTCQEDLSPVITHGTNVFLQFLIVQGDRHRFFSFLPPSWKCVSHPLSLVTPPAFILAELSTCSQGRIKAQIKPYKAEQATVSGQGSHELCQFKNHLHKATFFFFFCNTNPTKTKKCKGEQETFMQMSHFTFKFLSTIIHYVPENW